MKCPANYPELADSILQAVAQISTELSISCFITGGTLLGFYRGDGYIPWHNDIDVAMIHSHYFQLIDTFYRYGLVSDPFGKHEGRHFWKDDMLLDIHWAKPEGFYSFQDELEHNGVIYYTPYPIEEYLEWKYGPTWRTPLREGEYTLQHEH